MEAQTHRLVILAGPSCVGKSPLAKSFARFYSEINDTLKPLVLYNSRAPRPGEADGRDYHFCSEEEIEKLKEKEGFVVMNVRGDLQALDLNDLKNNLKTGDVLFEGNPFIGKVLISHTALKDINRLSIFMSPLSREEIIFLKSKSGIKELKDIVTDVMRRKLLRRTTKQKGLLSLKDLENIEKRASSAFSELQDAHHFQHIITNHDGEDHDNWDAFYYPLGDARKALNTFAGLLTGKEVSSEQWDPQLLH